MDIEIALDIINKQQDAWMNTSNDPVRFDIWDGLEAAKRRIQAAIIVAVLCHWGEATVQALTASPFAVGDRVKHRDGTIGTVIESRGGDAWIRVRWDNPDICMYWNPDVTSHYYDPFGWLTALLRDVYTASLYHVNSTYVNGWGHDDPDFETWLETVDYITYDSDGDSYVHYNSERFPDGYCWHYLRPNDLRGSNPAGPVDGYPEPAQPAPKLSNAGWKLLKFAAEVKENPRAQYEGLPPSAANRAFVKFDGSLVLGCYDTSYNIAKPLIRAGLLEKFDIYYIRITSAGIEALKAHD